MLYRYYRLYHPALRAPPPEENKMLIPLYRGVTSSYLSGWFLYSPPRPAGTPPLRGIRGKFPSIEGWHILMCRGGFFLPPRPTGTPPLRGIRGRFPSYRWVANSDLSGWFLFPTPPYGHPSTEGNKKVMHLYMSGCFLYSHPALRAPLSQGE